MKSQYPPGIIGVFLSVLLAACVPSHNGNSNSNGNANQPPPPPTTVAKITQPINGDKIDQKEVVKGTSQKVPSEQKIWVVIFIHKVVRYYPQNNPADIQANGDWASVTYFGIQSDVGLKFDILAVTADKSVQDAFNKYLKEARDKNSYPGLEQLPKEAIIQDRITVVRK